MSSYLNTAKECISKMMTTGMNGSTTVCTLVFFRDFTDKFVTHTVGPTADLAVLTRELTIMSATGGGDTPEAISEGLRAAADVVYASRMGNAACILVLITDAPPHGLSDLVGDSYPLGGPEGHVVDLFEQCDRLADLNVRVISVVAGRLGSAHDLDMGTIYRSICMRASPHDNPVVLPLEAKGHAADMLCELVTGVAAAEHEDALLADRIMVTESKVVAANPGLTEAERDDKVAELLAAEGVTATTIATDGAALFDDTAVKMLCATPSMAAAKVALSESQSRRGVDKPCASAPLGGGFLDGGSLARAASTAAGHLSSYLSPLSSADVRRSKGKGLKH
jgi:hypothetical protein